MAFLYATGNLIDINTLNAVSTEDAIYLKENLYNKRPSFPFRFTQKTDQTITIDLADPALVTLLGLFNHNLSSVAMITLSADTDPPDWNAPAYGATPVTWREEHLYLKLSETYRWWQIKITDAANPLSLQIGEAVLATHEAFTEGHIITQDEGDEYFIGSQETYMGQDWDVFQARKANLTLNVRKVSTAGDSVVEQIRALMRTLEGSAGRFVIIPDDANAEVYYMKVRGNVHTAARIFGNVKDIRDWSLSFVELSQGIELL